MVTVSLSDSDVRFILTALRKIGQPLETKDGKPLSLDARYAIYDRADEIMRRFEGA